MERSITRRKFLEYAARGMGFFLLAAMLRRCTSRSSSLTETPSPTLTPTETPTLTPTPTAETQEKLQQALADWLSGKTQIAPEELLRPQAGYEPIPFGTISPLKEPDKDTFSFFHGVLLGIISTDEQLVLIMGFEDKNGQRYTLPFTAGFFESNLPNQVVQQKSFEVGWQPDVNSKLISVSELSLFLPQLVGKPVLIACQVRIDVPEKDVVDESLRKYFLPTLSIGQEVYSFVHEATYNGLPPPSEKIKPLLNRVPEKTTIGSLPFSYYFQQVNWLPTP